MSANHAAKPMAVEHAQLSDLGMRRANNQDAVLSVIADDPAVWNERGHLFVVADGMGAHAAGELASKMAVDNVPHAYFKLQQLSAPAALRQAVREANQVIHHKGEHSIDFQGMGTTCTCMSILPKGCLVAHVGDSRAYRLRNHTLEQLTFDHSLIWETAAQGQMSEEHLAAVIPKNVITRSLGPHASVNVDLEGPFDVAASDIFLLCSDGLSGQVSDEELGAILSCLSPDQAAQTLVDVANLRGGPDNISVIVTQIGDQATTNKSHADRPSVVANRRVTSAPVWWALLASLGLLAGSVAADWGAGMVLGAAGCGAAIALAIARRNMPERIPQPAPLNGPYGNGPYRRFDCRPSPPVVDALAELAGQLRDLPAQESWVVELDWDPIEGHQNRAAQAAQDTDFPTAVTEYCHAIRITMKQLRELKSSVTTQSGLRLEE